MELESDELRRYERALMTQGRDDDGDTRRPLNLRLLLALTALSWCAVLVLAYGLSRLTEGL